MIDVQIVNSKGDLKADVRSGEYGQNGLAVLTEPLSNRTPIRKVFISDEYGQDMNVSIGYGSTPEPVFNGDNTYWTLSNITGTRASNSTGRPYAGSYSLRWDDPNLNNVFQLAKGNDFDLSNYVAITFWLNINNGLGTGDNIEIYGYRGISEVGNRIDLDNYCNPDDNDTWQFVTIPLTDLGLVNKTIDAIRFQLVNQNRRPDIYIDNMQIEEKNSELAIFKIEPDMQTHLYIYQIRLFMSDVYDSTLLNGTVPNICCETFLNVASLNSGIIMGMYRRNVPVQTNVLRNLGDFIRMANTHVSNYGSNGTNTFVTLDVDFPIPIELKWENKETFEIHINDNMSELLSFTASAMCSWHYNSLDRDDE